MSLASSLLFAWLVVHLLGLTSAWMVRMHAGGRGETFAHGLFFLSLAAVAVSALLGRQLCWSTWTFSAATLALMMMISLADFGQVRAGTVAIDG